MRQQVPTGSRKSKLEYQRKIVLSKRHLAPNRMKIDGFGYGRSVFPLKIFLKSRLWQGNPEPWCNHPCWDPTARRMRKTHRGTRLSLHIPQDQVFEDLFTCIGMKKVMKRTFLAPESYLQVNIAKVSLNIPTFQNDYPICKLRPIPKIQQTRNMFNSCERNHSDIIVKSS